MEKQEKREKQILTENRLATVNKRETYFEEGDADSSSLPSPLKNQILQPKIAITPQDLDLPFMRQLRQAIINWESALKVAPPGRDAYIIKKALIEMRKEQYIIKLAYRKPAVLKKIMPHTAKQIELKDDSFLDEHNEIQIRGFSLMSPDCVSLVLCNYSDLVQDSYDNFLNDTWYLMKDFDGLCGRALAEFPLYERIVLYKIDGMLNRDIQEQIQLEFGIKHSMEYISSLWRKKIPKIIADCAKREFLEYQYRKKRLPLKKCSRCGQKKPAHHLFFSKNNTSKDSFYSICKKCRNKK